MTPLAKSQNLAARMGRWSAAHRKTAIFGWLAFVFVAVVLGKRDRHEVPRPRGRRGRRGRRALQIIDRGGFAETAGRRVRVRPERIGRRPRAPSSRPSSQTSSPASPAPTASPRSARRSTTRARLPGRARRLVQYELSDEDDAAVDRIEPDPRVGRRRSKPPTPASPSRRSAMRAPRRPSTRRSRRTSSGPSSRHPADARHPADRLRRAGRRRDPALLGLSAVAGRARPPRSRASSSRWTTPPPRSSC